MLGERLALRLRSARAKEQVLEIKLAAVRDEITYLTAKLAEVQAPRIPPRTLRALEMADVPTGDKRCHWCKQVKPLSAFHKNRQTADGYHIYCKACRGVKKAQVS